MLFLFLLWTCCLHYLWWLPIYQLSFLIMCLKKFCCMWLIAFQCLIKIISVVIENWTVERPPLLSQAYTSKLGLHAIYEFFKLYIVYIDTQAPPDAIMGRRLGIRCYHYVYGPGHGWSTTSSKNQLTRAHNMHRDHKFVQLCKTFYSISWACELPYS